MLRFCILSAQHDYRTPRRASIHFIAQEFARRGEVRFFSCRFSEISRWRRDEPRRDLAHRANRVEMFEGVACYLWKPLIHPVGLASGLGALEEALFEAYVARSPDILRTWIGDADVVLIESGISVVFFNLVKAINPGAKVVYSMSDDLKAIGAARYAQAVLRRIYRDFDLIRVPSSAVMDRFPGGRVAYIPHGIDTEGFETTAPSPYRNGRPAAVSVGSMLFDARFFDVAATRVPEVDFHVIGAGRARPRGSPGNVIYHPEMPFRETCRYLAHAALGVAPYRPDLAPPELADTSLKLRQYAHLGLPAVCPVEVAGAYPLRFGYDINDPQSLEHAVRAALSTPHTPMRSLSWSDVADQILAAL